MLWASPTVDWKWLIKTKTKQKHHLCLIRELLWEMESLACAHGMIEQSTRGLRSSYRYMFSGRELNSWPRASGLKFLCVTLFIMCHSIILSASSLCHLLTKRGFSHSKMYWMIDNIEHWAFRRFYCWNRIFRYRLSYDETDLRQEWH